MNIYNKIIKYTTGRVVRKIKSKREPIIIAGLGRCGTTLVYNSFQDNHYYLSNRKFLMLSENSVKFRPNFIYKTHDYPPESLPDNVRLIFMFGNPMNTVISTHRRINEWGKLHHEHLGSNLFEPNDQIFYKDTLNLYNLFDAWNRPQGFPFLSVKYESLFEEKTINAISDFVGFKYKLPPQKERKANWENHPLRDQLLEVYGELDKKIQNCDNFKLFK